MVQWFIIILVYDFAILKLSLGEVTLSLRLLHYKNRNGLTYENRPCDTRLEHDINLDGRCDTGFLFCLVQLPFQNPHNCTLGDHFTGFVGADDIHFINIDQHLQRRSSVSNYKKIQRSSLISVWFQPKINFQFNYPKTGVGLIVEVFDIDDVKNQTIHDSIDFYGRTLNDLKLYRSIEVAQPQTIYLRSLFGTYTNLTVDFVLYCSKNYYGDDCETFCSPNEQRYECDVNTGVKICRHEYFGQDCLSDVRACELRPCLNNGTCVVYLESYLCQCPKGFTGRSCEIGPAVINIDLLCNQTTCVHGDCSRSGKCVCHVGWISPNCNRSLIQDDGCTNDPCLHNSTCENLMDINPLAAYRCHCRLGYIGRNCEVAIVTSCERTPCIHGQCLKIDLYTELCICEEHWIGIDCSQGMPKLEATSGLSSSSKKIHLTTLLSSTDKTAIKSMKNLTLTPLTDDLREYVEWLEDHYTPNRSIDSHQSLAPPSLLDRNNYSPCLSAPCHHNSTCVIRSEHSFQCICSSSFIGIYCEIEILNIAHFQTNACESSPCQHQSICITKSNHDVQCICRPHYTGKYCEKPPPLLTSSSPPNPQCSRICQNGGICLVDESNKESCICKSPYYGLYCEFTKNSCNDSSCNVDPCTSNPCLSNGTCQSIMFSTNYTCLCPEQYTGDRCDFYLKSDPTSVESRDSLSNVDDEISKNPADLWPLAIVFGYVFSLMLVFIIIWFLWYGFTIRPQSIFHSDTPYSERITNRYQPYRLGVSNPLFFINQEYNSNQILKNFSNSSY
ncbi:unnamed protein product [Rotaria socialis]|uniref:EGF-like domain-containing protein n=1 Tax=Rotaria socialis TaxID=392032 RepID=A0A820V6G8_9BILA|nr:unnamed protein product [Rotaria socialis]